MKEIHDPNSGAILFKEDIEGDPVDKKIHILECKVLNLELEVNRLKLILDNVFPK